MGLGLGLKCCCVKLCNDCTSPPPDMIGLQISNLRNMERADIEALPFGNAFALTMWDLGLAFQCRDCPSINGTYYLPRVLLDATACQYQLDLEGPCGVNTMLANFVLNEDGLFLTGGVLQLPWDVITGIGPQQTFPVLLDAAGTYPYPDCDTIDGETPAGAYIWTGVQANLGVLPTCFIDDLVVRLFAP